jgi:hypothetical protein
MRLGNGWKFILFEKILKYMKKCWQINLFSILTRENYLIFYIIDKRNEFWSGSAECGKVIQKDRYRKLYNKIQSNFMVLLAIVRGVKPMGLGELSQLTMWAERQPSEDCADASGFNSPNKSPYLSIKMTQFRISIFPHFWNSVSKNIQIT